ncbi:MAG: hypothetical protein ACOYN4_14920 [Bacteroidales bacterium]
MSQIKFSLADVLTVLASIAFGFVCFMGANFLNIDNDKVWGMSHTTGCVVMAVVCSILLFSTAFGAKLLKRTSRNFKTCYVWEVVLLVLFVLFAIFFSTKSSPFPHYFTVTEQKSEINNILQTNITQAENMFAAYESYADNRKNLYKSKLQAVINAKGINPVDYSNYGFVNNGVSDAKQIENKMFTVNADLFPTNYSEISTNNGLKEVATKWLQNAKSITSGWKPIGIVGVVNDIEKNSKDWLNTLDNLSQVREQNEQATDFEYYLSFEDVKSHFTKLDSPTPLSIGLAMLAFVLMLLSWFVTKRSTRFPGLKFLFSFGKSNDNEL